ncbi:unnamed protein product [Rotaria sordida]|uniref:Uncharacterized protein n=1 Tax=Rotaria sordida TaxID=392033 RepID=A0A814TSX3_9BILA|nr:unnamed protein product [Rotaria sordida]CAF1173001.1 unnamed protein product [Rotaria sordida]CAF3676575.1 unnamed protein product [Rotaria sordida]CAF3706000.1 unnamed protein product [Rotaria sordida]
MSTSDLNPSSAIDCTGSTDKKKYGNFELCSDERLNDLFSNNDDNDDGKYHDIQIIKMCEQSWKDILTTAPTMQYLSQIHSIRPTITSNHLEELRSIAILMYKIFLLEKLYSLWTIYRKLGKGELELLQRTKPLTMNIWPFEVHLRLKHIQQTNIYDGDTYRMFVDHCLKKLNEKIEECRSQLRYRTSHMIDDTLNIKETIEKFVQQGFMYRCLEYDCQIELIQYYYTDRILKRQYLSENTNEKQIQLLKRLSSNAFQNHSIIKSSLDDSIQDVTIREKLYHQYTEVAEQVRVYMMTLYMYTTEGHMRQCQKQYSMAMNQIWRTERALPVKKRLTPTMIHLIEQRLANIDSRLACIYKYKAQLSKLKAKTP